MVVKPHLKYERELWAKGYTLIIGVDEVGRGSFAGPLVAGAVALEIKSDISWEKVGINDSKKLSSKKREELDKIIRKNAWGYGIGEVGVAYINKFGIAKATGKAMRQAVAQVRRAAGNNLRTFVLVDAFHVKYIPGVGLKNQKGIIRGDQKSMSIASASIIAKAHRDKLMGKLGKKYPKYHWVVNKGYGTKEHREAIRKFGLSKLHRKLFVREILNSKS